MIKTWGKLNIQKKTALITTIVVGIIAHGMMLFNKLSIRDDLTYFFSGGLTFSLGRWGLYLIERIKNLIFQDSIYSIPTINGFFLIFCLAISICLLLDIYKIKTITLCVMISCIMISIPVIASMFGYLFIAQFFGISLLLSVLGPYLVLKSDKWYIILLSMILMTFSTGIYQAYIPIIISIYLFWLIQRLSQAQTKEERIVIYKKFPSIVLSLAGFLAFYFAGTNLFLKISGEKLSGYKGIGAVTNVPISDYFQRALLAYKEFFSPSRDSFYNIFPGSAGILFRISIIVCICLFAVYCWSIRKNRVSLALTVLLSLLIPLASNFIFVMVDATYCNSLMTYGYVMFFLFLFWIYEQTQPVIRNFLFRIIKICIYGLFSLMIIIFVRYDNLCYMRLEITQSQTTRFYTTLITRIQSAENYNASMKIAFIGNPRINDWDTTIPEISELNYIRTTPYFGFRESLTYDSWRTFMEIWLNFKAWEEKPTRFMTLPEVKNMSCYPNDGSIKVVDGVLVVKFQEIED